VIKNKGMGWAAWEALGRRKKCMLSLIGKPEGEGLLVRPRSRWKDDIRVDVKKPVCEIVDSVHMAQSRLQCLADVGTLWVP
jgi:hypothetical protein